jgi:hypothetical protein
MTSNTITIRRFEVSPSYLPKALHMGERVYGIMQGEVTVARTGKSYGFLVIQGRRDETMTPDDTAIYGDGRQIPANQLRDVRAALVADYAARVADERAKALAARVAARTARLAALKASPIGQAYLWQRQVRPSATARDCLTGARLDVKAGRARYPSHAPILGAPSESRGTVTRWCEKPADIGLRLVGFADELAPRSVKHSGWYTSEDGINGNNLRGAVYQLPTRNGVVTMVPAYVETDGGIEGAACFALLDHYVAPAAEADDAKLGAALRADQIAERAADEERAYQAAWQAGAQWAEKQEEIATTRSRVLGLLRERKAAMRDGTAARHPTICDMIRQQALTLREGMQRARAEMVELHEGARYNRDAFNEGAGL